MNRHTLKQFAAFLLGSGLPLTGTPAVADPIMIYVHTDHLGSPVAETDSLGTVIKRQSYTPYGEDGQGTTPDGPGFTGHRTDADTGLVYMQARYYDAEIGRFLSVDPVTFSPDKPQQFNRYWYANGNPYLYLDPDGEAVILFARPPLIVRPVIRPRAPNESVEAYHRYLEHAVRGERPRPVEEVQQPTPPQSTPVTPDASWMGIMARILKLINESTGENSVIITPNDDDETEDDQGDESEDESETQRREENERRENYEEILRRGGTIWI